MADYFCDSSGLVKRYANEAGTAWVQGVCDPATGNAIWVSRITGAEVVAAFWRKARVGTVSAADATTMTDDFKDHFRHQYRSMDIGEALVEDAMILVQRHGLRGYDSVQLASAVALDAEKRAMGESPIIFVSADDSLLASAQAEGLTTENPNHHP